MGRLSADSHLLIVSNRLPAVVTSGTDGRWRVNPSSGGLVTALLPVMRQSRGTWIGWPGCGPEAPAASLLEAYSREQGFTLRPVTLTAKEVTKYYRGFANRAIWPLFHDLLGYCRFDFEEWNAYLDVNRRFASAVMESVQSHSLIWVHDYQLLLVGRFLRELGFRDRLSFFLHIPFPSRDLIRRLPWHLVILNSLLEYDHLGFQTMHDFRNFVQCVKTFIPEAQLKSYRRRSDISYEGRTIRLGHYPISIDFDEFHRGAHTKEAQEAAWYIHENLSGRKLILGLDRLDYTKGIPERFLAFERALEKYPDLLDAVSLVQIVVPSRIDVPDYQHLKEDLDRMSGKINARFSRHGWVPLHYMFRSLDRHQLIGYYRACEIALITPLRDGMNLVAKEYCASSVDNNGVLILSLFAGAAEQLGAGAITVNPYDLESTADAIYKAYKMSGDERARRMKLLRSEVRRNNVRKWLRAFLDRSEFPVSGPTQVT